MAVDEQLIQRASKGNLRAAILVLSDRYPSVHRIAYALTGGADVGRGIVKFILRRALRQLPTWNDEAAAVRWCRHHTVLLTRRALRHAPDVSNDVLIKTAKTDNAYYAAFIRALRALPIQQREAFILHHGEQLDTRPLAVSMDCSTEAASNHLREATRSLSALSGEYAATFTAQLAQTYQALTPDEAIVLNDVRWNARKYHWPRRLLRVIQVSFFVLVTIVLLLFFLRIYPKLVI